MRKNEKVFLNLVKQGIYRIYKNGNIYRCKKTCRVWNGEYKKCKPILQNMKVEGYMRIDFGYREKVIHIYAHRAVWLYFNGNISKNLETNHKNGIKTDNRLNNLELVTRKENVNHSIKIGLRDNRGENNGSCKLKIKDVLKIKKLLMKGIYQYKIAKMFNVTRANIGYINRRKIWDWLE